MVIGTVRLPVQTPLGARPGFWAQPPYEAPADPRIEVVNTP